MKLVYNILWCLNTKNYKNCHNVHSYQWQWPNNETEIDSLMEDVESKNIIFSIITQHITVSTSKTSRHDIDECGATHQKSIKSNK